jgi:hypothetical protein
MDFKKVYEDIMNSDPKIRLVTICNLEGKIMHSGHRQGVTCKHKDLEYPNDPRNSSCLWTESRTDNYISNILLDVACQKYGQFLLEPFICVAKHCSR